MPRDKLIQIRRGTTAEWDAADAASESDSTRLLAPGELGRDTTTGTLKVGDGSTTFAKLPGYLDESALSASIDGTVRARKTVPASRSVAYGHSYMHGSSPASSPAGIGVGDMQTLIAAGVELPTLNRAVSGATLHDAASSGDWADVLQAEVRGTAFEPVGGLFVNMWGLNDAAQIGHTYAELAPFREALRLVVSRQRCAAVFEDSHPSVALGGSGTWATYAGTGRNSGGGCRYNNTAGATVTITPPADFPGGTIVLGFPVWGDGSSCTWSTTVNGITYSVDTATVARTGNHPTVAVLRIPNVKRTNGPIVLTSSNLSSSGGAKAAFDWWGWEPAEDACPLVVLVGQPKPLDYTSQATAPAGPVTDAGVDTINAILQEVAEIGSRVIYVDTSALDKSATYFVPGDVHPTGAGHARLAELVTAAIADAATVVRAPSKEVAAPGATVAYTPTFDGNGTALGSGTATGSYRDLPNGDREFLALVTLAADSTIGSTAFVGLPSPEVAGTLGVGAFEAHIYRSGGTNPGTYPIRALLGTSSGKAILRQQTLDANGRVQSISATAPLTPAAGDVIRVTGIYRAF